MIADNFENSPELINTEIVSNSSSSLITNVTTSRPALSWCSKCGQSMEISSESILYKSKTNFKFRKIFDFDNTEVLIKTFSCALVDDILFQGTLYASQNHFCFYTRIANKHKKIIVPISQIEEITKEKTAGIFPNAIAIKTQHTRYLFASFVYRDVAFRCLSEVWASHQAERFSTKWRATKKILNEIHPHNLYLNTTESSDINDPVLNLQRRSNHRSKDLLRKLRSRSIQTNSIPDYSTESNIPNPDHPKERSMNIIAKDYWTFAFAIATIVLLILYIIVLAWKINSLQLKFLERVMDSQSIPETEFIKTEHMFQICPATDSHCNRYVESVVGHRSRMSKVQSDLKETLGLLQTVVKISSQMFGRLQMTTLTNIFKAPRTPDDI